MEFYPTELTSPPVPLVALVGKPELHVALGDFLRSQNVPRIHSIGIPDAHSAAGTFGVKKAAPSSSTPGILKAGWLRKHRNSRPAVAAVLVDSEAVVGDPSAWAWLVSQLDAVKSATRSRGARIVVVIVQRAGMPLLEVPEDRIAMICRQAGVERRCVLTFAPSEGLPALQVIGKVLHDQSVAFYAADAQRRLAAHAHRNVPSTDLNLRIAFKLGALAEFRGDWAAALRMYREAYGYIPQVLAGCASQPHRFAEIRTVAEYVHVKLASLLLLALKQVADALAQFEAHLRLFRRVPFEAPPGLLASHHAWLCRQYTVMAELVMSSGADVATLKREHQPGQLYLAAARAAIERRKVAAFISGMHAGKEQPLPGRVVPGLYVGQFLLLPSDPAAATVAAGSAAVAAALAGLPVSGASAAAGAAKRLSEEQFEAHLQAEEGRPQHSKSTVDLLRTAQGALQSSGRRTGKTLQHVMQLLGHELLEAGDAAGAGRLLTNVAGCYRQQRWEAPLASTLLLLRECRQQEHNLQAHTELSLELSALQDSSLDSEQRRAMATAAVSVLALGEVTAADSAQAPEQQLQEQQQQQQRQQQQEAGMQYVVEDAKSGWLTVLPLCAGFFDTNPDAAAAAPATPLSSVRFGAAVWNNAPIDLPVSAADLHLQDATGTFTVPLLPEPAGSSCGGSAAETFLLPTTSWLRLAASIPVRCSGQLQATELVLHFGAAGSGGSSITFRLAGLMPAEQQQPAARSAAAATVGWLGGGWAGSRPPFSVAAGFLAGRCSIEVPPQHTPPLLLLQSPEVLLQGEQAALTVIVAASDADAIHGAALRCTAAHADSQQQLGLAVLGAAQRGLQQQLEGHGKHERGQGSSGLAQQLGDIEAGQRRQVVLLLDARYRGSVQFTAELKYTVPAHSTSSGRSVPEQGHCSASLAVQVQPPWKLALQLLGPPTIHTLLAAPRAGHPGTTNSGEAGAETLLLDQQQRRLQGLQVQDGSTHSSASAESVVGEGPKDLSLLLLRSLPQRLVLPVGQPCSAVVQLQSQAACQLDLLAVELEGADGLAVAPALPLPPASPSEAEGLADAAAASALGRSDVYTAIFSLSSSSSTAATELPSLGFLRLRWRRHQRRPPLLAAATRGTGRLDAAAAKAAAEAALSEAEYGSGSPTAAAAPTAPACEVLVPLPAVSLLQPLLTASVRFPPVATAGSPADLQLVLENSSSMSQEVAVAVGDPHGFLLAGPKSTRIQVLPQSSSSVSWQAVPYHTGLLRLPEITVAAVQHGQAVEVARGCTVFVERPLEQLLQEDEAPIAGLLTGTPDLTGAVAVPAAEEGAVLIMEPGII